MGLEDERVVGKAILLPDEVLMGQLLISTNSNDFSVSLRPEVIPKGGLGIVGGWRSND